MLRMRLFLENVAKNHVFERRPDYLHKPQKFLHFAGKFTNFFFQYWKKTTFGCKVYIGQTVHFHLQVGSPEYKMHSLSFFPVLLIKNF